MSAHRRNSSEQRSSSRRGISPTTSTAATSVRSRRASSRTVRHASSRPVRSRSTRFIDTCGRPADASIEPERAHAGQPAVGLADLACDAARDGDVGGDEEHVDREQRLAARPRRSRPASGAAPPGRSRVRVNGMRGAASREDRARRGRRRRRRTRAPRACRPTTARTRAPRPRPGCCSTLVPPSATNGTTSSAPR